MDSQTIVIAVLTLIGSVFASQGFWTWMSNRNSNKTAQARLLLGLAYPEIERRAKLYIARGSISTDEYHDFIEYLYTPYKDMGGDGIAEKLVKDVEKLPFSDEKGAKA